MALAEGIRSEGQAPPGARPKRERFLRMLGAGSPRYAYEMLTDAGVDLATPQPFDAAMREMNAVMDRIEAIVAQRGSARGGSQLPVSAAGSAANPNR